RELRDGRLIDLFPRHTCTASAGGFDDPDAWLLRPSRSYTPAKVEVVSDFLLDQFRTGSPWDTATAE
ncbi:MAG: hypothetical protein AAGK78_00650, partial [Planctomycetota bacterium]